MRVVVCIDEPSNRHHVASVIEGHGDEVVAATDTAFEAIQVAEQFGVDAMVVDLRVRVSLGQHPLDDVDRPDRRYHVIISTDLPKEISTDRPRLTVVERHDDPSLVSALERLADVRGPERRQSAGRVPLPRDTRAVYDGATAFYQALAAAEAGDVLLAMTVGDESLLEELGAVCRRAIRREDFLLRQSRDVVAFLPAGDRTGHGAALERIRRAWTNPQPIIAVRRVLSGADGSGSEAFVEAMGELHAEGVEAFHDVGMGHPR
ncbi:MAG TPA: response regulator [Acidimicrobiales bacterium]